MMRKFLVRSLSITLLMQLHSTPVHGLPLRTSAIKQCSVNQNTYTQADVTEARVELERHRNLLRRLQDLAKTGVVPPSEVDEAVYWERLARIKLELTQTATSSMARVTEAEAKAQLRQAQAELELRRIQLERQQRLADEGAIARVELLEAIQAERKARANLEKAQACLIELM
ncbi:MAG TPA: hypothetical protein V6C91_06645 [Coleofasciculaceae cyanobacterium]